jgi:hypothetical protein
MSRIPEKGPERPAPRNDPSQRGKTASRHPTCDPALEEDRLESGQRAVGYRCWIDSLPPNYRAQVEASIAVGRARREEEERAERERLAALRLSSREAEFFRLLQGEAVLSGDIDEGDELERDELIELLYGMRREARSRPRRRRLWGCLRAMQHRLNRKLKQEGFRVRRSSQGCVRLVSAVERVGRSAENRPVGRPEAPEEQTVSAERLRELEEEIRRALGMPARKPRGTLVS